jgi:hypothetical protein
MKNCIKNNMAKQICCFFSLLLFWNNVLHAQLGKFEELQGVKGDWEASLSLGVNNFLGDLGGTPGAGGTTKDYTLQTIRPLAGLSLAYNPGYAFAVKAGINYTSVFGADSLIKNTNDLERWRVYRNANFRSKIIEGYLGVDIYPMLLFDKYNEIRQYAPFIGLGVGVFHFNPQTYYGNQWIDLQPLRLEGQGFAEYPDRKPYSLTQVYIPINIGLKYYFSNKLAMSGGLMMRHTNTDYIDDNSTTYIDPALFDNYLPSDQATLAKALYSRSITPQKVKPGVEKADSKNNDTYLTLFFTVSLRLSSGPHYFNGR